MGRIVSSLCSTGLTLHVANKFLICRIPLDIPPELVAANKANILLGLKTLAKTERSSLNKKSLFPDFKDFLAFVETHNNREFWGEVFNRSTFGGNPERAIKILTEASKSAENYNKLKNSLNTISLVDGPVCFSDVLLATLGYPTTVFLGIFSFFRASSIIGFVLYSSGILKFSEKNAISLGLEPESVSVILRRFSCFQNHYLHYWGFSNARKDRIRDFTLER